VSLQFYQLVHGILSLCTVSVVVPFSGSGFFFQMSSCNVASLFQTLHLMLVRVSLVVHGLIWQTEQFQGIPRVTTVQQEKRGFSCACMQCSIFGRYFTQDAWFRCRNARRQPFTVRFSLSVTFDCG